ncbi:MAG: efflux RND transporter permease subunit [Rhodobacteraceae bacterium]|nr:efflux RND transporter permease subunit [Paracoccaceae bacterium]
MIRLFAAHPTAANILMLIIMVVGFISVPTLQRDTFPVVPASVVEVRIAYPGASPAEVEQAICTRVEDPIQAVDFLDELRCVARDNVAVISAELVEGGDINGFYDDVKSAVDTITSFPDEVKKPTSRIVERIATVASVAITGPDDPAVLFAYAEAFSDKLKRHPMISQTRIAGFSEREISIEVPAVALSRYGLSIDSIANALARNSFDLPAGTMESHEGDALLRFVAERRTPEEFANIPLTSASLGAEVLLGEVAEISVQFSEEYEASYFNGKRAAIVTVTKTAAQDAIRVMDVMKTILEAERSVAPEGISLEISSDTTSNILDRLRIITDNGLQGLVLVFVVMWVFFGFRFSFWVAMGLPVSFLGTIFVMQLFGLTINMITMVALLVAIGLLMDDAIVISENIVSRRQKGDEPLVAAINGTKQVMPGVIASFLTTAMIVGPLGMMAGNIGAVLKFLPIVLLITLTVSLFEAFLILPHHLKHALKNPEPSRFSQAISRGFDGFRDRVVAPLSLLSLKARYLTMGLAGFLILLSIAPMIGGQIKFKSFPALESDTIEARLLLPQGTPLWRTEERVAKTLKALEALNAELSPLQPEGKNLVGNVTVSYGANADADETGAHLATISANLLRAEDRNSNVTTIIERWKKLTGPMPDMSSLRFTDKDRGVGGKPIAIRLQGGDLDALKATAIEMRKFFRGFAGVRDVIDDLRPGKPEYVVTLRSASASALGISAQDVASQLRRAFRGDTTLEVQDRYGSLDVLARLKAPDRASANDVLDLRIAAGDGTLVPLSAVADVTQGRGYARIQRIDARRTVTVEGSINPGIANAVELMAALKADFLPQLAQRRPDVDVVIIGESKDTSESGNSLRTFILIGLAGVYLILAYQFRSFIQPVAVFVAIPLGLVGVVWGHMLMGMQISMPSLVGLATLAGIVVNNSILLIAFIKERYNQGDELIQAAQGAVRDRFRPIFLTSLTTIAGLGPLLFETSTQAQLLLPIVASLAFGLTTATVLALFVTPAMFLILHDMGLIRRARPNGDDA